MLRTVRLETSFILLASCMLAVGSGCSSGGSEEEGSIDSNGACEVVGTKIANGQQCRSSATNDSAIIRLSFVSRTQIGTCSGTALDDYTVLTAAHCFADSFNYILVETENSAQETNNFAIANVNFSGNWRNQIIYNDAALIFVNKKLGVPSSPILGSRNARVGEEVVIAGFGETVLGGPVGDLHAGRAWISDATANHLFITYKAGQSHPCRGDSGGPLLVQVGGTWAIAGVASQSDPSVSSDNICSEGDVTLYTNLQKSDVLAFLNAHVPDIDYR